MAYEFASGNLSSAPSTAGSEMPSFSNHTNGSDLENTNQLAPYFYSFVIIMAPVGVLGIIGNILVIHVILSRKHMRTCANMLFLNLACADLMFLLVFLPSHTATLYIGTPVWMDDIVCKTVNFVRFSTVGVSIYTLIAIGVFRYLAICYPFEANRILTKRNAGIVGAIVWVVIGSVNSFIFITYKKIDGEDCILEEEHYIVFLVIVYGVDFFLPVLVISVVTFLIIRRLRASSSVIRAQQAHGRPYEPTGRASQKKLVVLLMAVVIAFLVCFLPFQLLFIIQSIHNLLISEDGEPLVYPPWLFHTATMLFGSNSSVNPLIYNFVSEEFRKAFKATLQRAFCKKRRGLADRKRGGTFSDETELCIQSDANSSRKSHDSRRHHSAVTASPNDIV